MNRLKNLRFWQKLYLAVLAVFLLFLTIAVVAMSAIGYQQNLNSEIEKAKADQQRISLTLSQAFTEDDTDNKRLEVAAKSLNNGARGAFIELREGDTEIYSGLPKYAGDRPELSVKEGTLNQTIRTIDGVEYLYLTSALEDNSAFVLTYAYSLEGIDESWQSLIISYVVISFGLISLLAIVLYFLLKRFSKPLERVAQSARTFADGDRSSRITHHSHDEVGDIAESFNYLADTVEETIEELERSSHQKQELVDNLSHEIRTPITAIQGYAEYLQQVDLTSEQTHEVTSVIVDESARLKNIAENMLKLASFQEGNLVKSPFSSRELIESTLKSFYPRAVKESVDFHVKGLHDVTLSADRQLVEMLLSNIIDNAMKACGDQGLIEVSAYVDQGNYHIRVTDNGTGMTREQLKNIGEPFYRTDTARSRQEGGAGLGVALCKRIVEAHGGKLYYESERGKGTSVVIILQLGNNFVQVRQ